MELLSRLKKNEILFNYFPFDVSQLSESGLYMNNITYIIFKFMIWATWIVVFSWNLFYWKPKILLFLSTWNLIFGVIYSTVSLLELIFIKKLKPYKIWRISHFIFVSLLVLSILIVIFDISLIDRSYIDYTDNQSVASFLYYTTAYVPVAINIIELIFNNVMLFNFKCLAIYIYIGGPYTVVLTLYTLLVEPIYQQITFKDQNTIIIFLSTCVITGISYAFVRVYCEVFKLTKAIQLLSQLTQKSAVIKNLQIKSNENENQLKKPRSIADYTKMAAYRKPPPMRQTRGKLMLPSLRNVFSSIITQTSE